MKLAAFGPTGETGRRLTTQALAAGREVRALARSPPKFPHDDQITAVEGDVLDPEPVARTIANTDAVLSAWSDAEQSAGCRVQRHGE